MRRARTLALARTGLRVVAGAMKGHRLAAPRGRATRPTADRVREAVFNLLGSVEGLRVLDLFAGSGALGIEALSRGAAAACFVDSDARAAATVRENLERVGAGPAGEVVRSDWRAFLRRAASAGRSWDLALCDPPYRLADRLAGDLSAALGPVLAPGARVVCESPKNTVLRLDLPLVTERRYGDTVITVHAAPERDEV